MSVISAKGSLWTAVVLVVAFPAWAVQICKPGKKDSRVWTCVYDPDNIYKVWSAPNAELMFSLAPDEQVINVEAADTEVVKGGWSDNLATLKFQGCALPQQAFIVTHKTSNNEARHYVFSIETVPQVCSKDIPSVKATPNLNPNVTAAATVAYTDGVQQNAPQHSMDALPDLRHLEHPDDLAESSSLHGGHIPFLIKILYPGDDKAKRDADAAAALKRERKQRVEQVLSTAASGIGPTTGFRNSTYAGRGAAALKPVQNGVSDDGNATTISWPPGIDIPAISKLTNLAKGCGPDGEERIADDSVHTNPTAPDGTRSVRVTFVGQGWCLRRDGQVYEIRNLAYDPYGHRTNTGTLSPVVERKVIGSPDVKGDTDGN